MQSSNYSRRVQELLSMIQEGVPAAVGEIQEQLDLEIHRVEIDERWIEFLQGRFDLSISERIIARLRNRMQESAGRTLTQQATVGAVPVLQPNEAALDQINTSNAASLPIPNLPRAQFADTPPLSDNTNNNSGGGEGITGGSRTAPTPVMIVAPVPLPVTLIGGGSIRGGRGAGGIGSDESEEDRNYRLHRGPLDILGAATNDGIKGIASMAARGIFGASLGPVGVAVSAVLMLGEAALKAGENLKASNLKLAEWSASMSQVQADSMMRNIHYDQIRGEKLAPSADRFIKAWDEFMFKFNTEITDRFTERKNVIGTFLAKRGSDVLSGGWRSWLGATLGAALVPMAGIYGPIIGATLASLGANKKDQDEGKGENLGTWMAETGAKWYEDHGKPGKFEKGW